MKSQSEETFVFNNSGTAGARIVYILGWSPVVGKDPVFGKETVPT